MNPIRISGLLRYPKAAIRASLASGTALLVTLSPSAYSQSEYVNFEVGAVRPIEIAHFTQESVSETLSMVCNPGDHSLEFYRVGDGTSAPVRIADIPTGLYPVTVRFDAATNTAYTCNHLGDSISKITVTPTVSGTTMNFDIKLVGNYPVGDEPTDLVIFPGGTGKGSSPAVISVSLRSRSGVAELNPVTMEILSERVVPSVSQTLYPVGIRNPVVMSRVGDELFILDKQSDATELDTELFDTQQFNKPLFGVNINATVKDDLDILVARAQDPTKSPNPFFNVNYTSERVGGLGTTHHDMVVDSDGKYIYVVGTKAVPGAGTTENDLRDLATGFAQSFLWVVDVCATPQPAAVREWGIAGSTFNSINLNRDYGTLSPLTEISPTVSRKVVSHPTGVALYEVAGSTSKVVVTAFSSDDVAVLTPNSALDGGWDVKTLRLNSSGAPYSMAGPRGVQVDSVNGIAYVMCSLDNTLRVIDIAGTAPALMYTVQLNGDHTPAEVAASREFLYGAKHSLTGTVSCASCHVDGHTDGLGWTLEPSDDGDVPKSFWNFSAGKISSFLGLEVANGGPMQFSPHKGRMVTQSLRGMLNYPVEENGQSLVTNAPYHWRGDRDVLEDFNIAFPELLGGSALDTTAGGELDQFVELMNGIMHPPNPEQPKDRRLSGSLGNPRSTTRAWDASEGSGLLRGLKLFHSNSLVGVSCAHCHQTPEGSGNRATSHFDTTLETDLVIDPLEVAALRNIFDREPVLPWLDVLQPSIQSTANDTLVRVKTTGLFHEGSRSRHQTISHFVEHRFKGCMPGVGKVVPHPTLPGRFVTDGWDRKGIDGTTEAAAVEAIAQTLDLTRFVRALDSGTAPGIGSTFTFTATVSENVAALDFMIEQANEANADVVIYSRVPQGGGFVERGFWYDVVSGMFHHDASIFFFDVDLPRSYFEGQVATNAAAVVIAEVVPLGSGRSLARPLRTDAVDPSVLSNISLEPMAMATQWAEAGDLRAFWDNSTSTSSLTWFPDDDPMESSQNKDDVEPRNSHLMQLQLQSDILTAQMNDPSFEVGVEVKKHEPPRRFRVAGDGIGYGAKLLLTLPSSSPTARTVEFPIFATKHMNGNGHRIWETAVEIDGEMTLALLCGGPDIDEVADNLNLVGADGSGPATIATDPIADNWYTYTILNPNGTSLSGASAVRLTVQNVR